MNSKKNKLIILLLILSVSVCTFLTPIALATVGHTYFEDNHVFLVGDAIGFAPFASVTRNYIAVDYTKNSSTRTINAATSLECACTFWGGAGIATLTPGTSGYAWYYADSTDNLLQTQQLYYGVSFYKVTNSSWYAIGYSGTNTKCSMGYSRIRAEGNSIISVPDALIPGYTFHMQYSF